MLFGTSGIRGDAEKLFNEQFCFDIGRSFSKFLENHRIKGDIAIGMDPRESSQRIKEGIASGILQEGRKVFDEGFSPSPAMNYILIANEEIAGSIMITGSHIRPDFNGVKFFAFKKEILKEHEKEIEQIYEEIKNNATCGYNGRMIADKSAGRLYQDMLLNLAQPYPEWKIVLDLCNGCQSEIMPGLFERLDMDVTIINSDPIPERFIARDTEVKDAVDELCAKVKEIGADLGIAFDGDGDRVVFVDEDGRFITGDYSGTLIAQYSDTPIVVTPINTSHVVDYIGKPVIRTIVGSSRVVQAMEESGALFGFEANGGGISKEVMLSRDAGSSMIKILNIMKKSSVSLKELVDTLPRFYIYRAKVECPMSLYPAILESAKGKLWHCDVRIEDIDGIKVWVGEDSWVLFRPSINAPEFRVFAESKSEEEAIRLGEEGMDFVIGAKRRLLGMRDSMGNTPIFPDSNRNFK